MSTDENKRLVRRYIEEVVNTGNVDEIAAFVGPANLLEPLLAIGAIRVVGPPDPDTHDAPP